MGEDREKRNGDVLPSSRQRHSSVISSCSEDAESETSGYPPTPDEEREEELEYGPGIVNKLRTRFLTISLKQNRGASIRRSCSMENLLDQDRPSRGGMFSPNTKFTDDHTNHHVWGNLKRAKSMDTLLMDLQPEPPPAKRSEVDSKKEPKIVLRREGCLVRTGQIICDEELPKPDTVKTYKRMFEPAESRRGSYSRRPPVLRASAKSGSLSVSKINGVSPSAKVNGSVSKSKSSAKQPSPPVKAQPELESVIKNGSVRSSPSPVNGEDSKPVCNGGFVKAVPVKIVDKTLCNGKIEKTVETEVKGLQNNNKKESQNNQKNSILCNGNATHKELIKSETSEDYVKPDVKKLVKQTNKVVNGSDSPITNIVNGITTKPKIPPNRPTFIKNVKPATKIAELNGTEKKAPLVPKLKPVSVQRKIAEISKVEPKKTTEAFLNEPKLNGLVNKEVTEAPKGIPNGNKNIEENNRKNVEKAEPVTKETIPLDKTDVTPKKEPQKEIINHVNGDIVDTEKATVSHRSDPVEMKHEIKTIKKSSDPITTSMVFDFRGKDVVPHVAVLPVPFGCKALHPKKKTVLIDGKEVLNGVASDDEDEYHMDYSVPPPCGVTFEGENIKIGKGSILSTRNKDLKIKFDDNVDDNTFVYPSESSLLEDGEQQPQSSSPSPTPPSNEVIPNGQPPPNKLKANTVIGSSGAGGLSTYTPSVLRTMDNFEPGMFRPPPSLPEKEDADKGVVQSGEEENTQVRGDDDDEQSREESGEMLKPADPGIISSWSLSAGTSDLLF